MNEVLNFPLCLNSLKEVIENGLLQHLYKQWDIIKNVFERFDQRSLHIEGHPCFLFEMILHGMKSNYELVKRSYTITHQNEIKQETINQKIDKLVQNIYEAAYNQKQQNFCQFLLISAISEEGTQ